MIFSTWKGKKNPPKRTQICCCKVIMIFRTEIKGTWCFWTLRMVVMVHLFPWHCNGSTGLVVIFILKADFGFCTNQRQWMYLVSITTHFKSPQVFLTLNVSQISYIKITKLPMILCRLILTMVCFSYCLVFITQKISFPSFHKDFSIPTFNFLPPAISALQCWNDTLKWKASRTI